MKKIQGVYKIVSNKRLSESIYHLCIDATAISKQVKPGQFVHIKVNEGLNPFFRRPFSVYRAKKHLEILYEVVGAGTRSLSLKKTGAFLDVLGPLGNHFLPPPKGVKEVVMIAGGIGVAPFLAFTDILKKKKIKLILLYGGRTKGHIVNIKEFQKNQCKVFVSTDDGSRGVKGRVSKLFNKINIHSQEVYLYTCGPKPMMRSVKEVAKKCKLRGQASCEEVMACGVGTCLGCVCKKTILP